MRKRRVAHAAAAVRASRNICDQPDTPAAARIHRRGHVAVPAWSQPGTGRVSVNVVTFFVSVFKVP
jgi:hypothetical protein